MRLEALQPSVQFVVGSGVPGGVGPCPEVFRGGGVPFTTAVWKDPAARSYFARGAVSDTSGYIILPRSCWDKVGNIQGSRAITPGPDTVAIVEASVEGGSAHRRSLARLLTHTVQEVAEAAGCPADERKVYFAANWSTEYEGVLLDHTRNRRPPYSDVRRATFQNFLDAAAASRNCPQVTVPR
ncbi:hypothetical protein [Streptomyces griseus]|uniref:hypothetical protein n=1 Tax=Streptomyces griseus TaxID=1911 RepID=UPI0033F0516C